MSGYIDVMEGKGVVVLVDAEIPRDEYGPEGYEQDQLEIFYTPRLSGHG